MHKLSEEEEENTIVYLFLACRRRRLFIPASVQCSVSRFPTRCHFSIKFQFEFRFLFHAFCMLIFID